MGLNQTQLADVGGVTLGTQSRYEAGGLPSTEYLLRIGDAGADWYWIVTGTRIADRLSGEESQLVDRFRAIGPTARAAIMSVMACMPAETPAIDILDAQTGTGDFLRKVQAQLHDQARGFKGEEGG